MTDLIITIFMGFVVLIIVYELFRAMFFALRSKFILTYHIEVLCAKDTAWWYWQIIQTETKGGNYRFTYKEAVEFKAREVNDPWGDNMRIVRAR